MTALVPTWNALTESPLAAYGSYAPQFVPLPDEPTAAVDVARRFVEIDPVAPAVSVFASPSSEQALAGLFAYLAQATIDGDLPVHCRFADTRILPSLLTRLAPQQVARVARDISSWSWIDHLGVVASWQRSGASSADDSPHLQLTMPQMDAMLRASEPDTMFELLRDNTPELLPAEHRGKFRDRIAGLLVRADGRQVETSKDRLQFLILGLCFDDTVDEEPELQPTWQAIANRQTTLLAAMQAWDDALWERRELRREVVR